MVVALPPGRRSPAAKALSDMMSTEVRLAAELAKNARAALPRFLAADGRLMRGGLQPAWAGLVHDAGHITLNGPQSAGIPSTPLNVSSWV